jgi:hypothetical protein
MKQDDAVRREEFDTPQPADEMVRPLRVPSEASDDPTEDDVEDTDAPEDEDDRSGEL